MTPARERLNRYFELSGSERFDYLLVASTGIRELGSRLGRRTALTFPPPPSPQKN